MITTIPKFKENSIAKIPMNHYVNQKIVSYYKNYFQNRSDVKIVDSIIRNIITSMNLPISPKIVGITYSNEYENDGTQKRDAFSKPNHRDHFIHSLNVYSLGLALYSESLTIQKIFESCQQKPDWWQSWAFTSLFHDIGYYCNIDNPIIKENALDKIWEYLLDGGVQRSIFNHTYLGDNNDTKDRRLNPILSKDLIKEIIYKNYPDINQISGTIKPKSIFGKVGLNFKKESHPIIKLFESVVDHGVASEKLLNLLIELQSILNSPAYKYDLEKEGLAFERGFLADYSFQIEAIKYHGAQIPDVTKAMLSRNPWIGYLHVIDELQTYDRCKLKEKYSKYNKIEEISIEMSTIENDPIFFNYPKEYLPQIAQNVKEFQSQLLIEVRHT
jgi:hypothetical protein